MKRVGILGGGQLGMMLATALHDLGAETHIYDPDPDAPAKRRFANVTTGAWRDAELLAQFVSNCDVVTYEMEHVDREALLPFATTTPILPSLSVLETTQDRVREKTFFRERGLPCTRWAHARGRDDLRAAGLAFGFPFILKTARGGYDGKGQHRVASEAALDLAIESVVRFAGDDVECVLEEIVDIALELSTIVARSPDGAEAVFPVFENHHANHILDVTVVPARVGADLTLEAQELGLRAARELGVIGLLTTEMFVAKDGDGHRLLLNELAPRPHNSGHVTRTACTLSQFDALARVLLDVPLQTPRITSRGTFVMGNLLGDLWLERGSVDLNLGAWARHEEILDVVLYGKKDARRGRKLGHFVAHGPDAEAVVEAAREFRRELAQQK
jgi:5-(carboxyamino)imidazole ribonucleotide synthase